MELITLIIIQCATLCFIIATLIAIKRRNATQWTGTPERRHTQPIENAKPTPTLGTWTPDDDDTIISEIQHAKTRAQNAS